MTERFSFFLSYHSSEASLTSTEWLLSSWSKWNLVNHKNHSASIEWWKWNDSISLHVDEHFKNLINFSPPVELMLSLIWIVEIKKEKLLESALTRQKWQMTQMKQMIRCAWNLKFHNISSKISSNQIHCCWNNLNWL